MLCLDFLLISYLFICLPGENVVWQGWPSADSERIAGYRPGAQIRWTTQKPLCQNLFPAR